MADLLTEAECPKCGDRLCWYPAINERGWKCCRCGHKPGDPEGYCPGLDLAEIYLKVACLVHDLADAKLISISNGSHGDGVTGMVARRCQEIDRYDQTTILALILETDRSHVDYWHKIGAGVRSGNDPRDRCPGGRLATGFSHKNGERRCSCSDKTCAICTGDQGELPF